MLRSFQSISFETQMWRDLSEVQNSSEDRTKREKVTWNGLSNFIYGHTSHAIITVSLCLERNFIRCIGVRREDPPERD